MVILVYRTYRAERSGSTIRRVACEPCGSGYSFPIHLTTKGAGSSPFFLINGIAKRKAGERAEKNLQKAMEHAMLPVPCPHCGWMQAAMVHQQLTPRYRWMRLSAWIGLIGGSFFLLMLHATFSDQGRHPRYPERPFLIAAELLLIAACPTLLLLRRALVARQDPNRQWQASSQIKRNGDGKR